MEVMFESLSRASGAASHYLEMKVRDIGHMLGEETSDFTHSARYSPAVFEKLARTREQGSAGRAGTERASRGSPRSPRHCGSPADCR